MTSQTIQEGTILWEPNDDTKSQAAITKYILWLNAHKGLHFDDYHSLWQWSVTELEDFWQSLWEFFDIQSARPFTQVLSGRRMPGARWFEGAELNYAEHVFRHQTAQRPALLFQSETQPLTEVSWHRLYREVAAVATAPSRTSNRSSPGVAR